MSGGDQAGAGTRFRRSLHSWLRLALFELRRSKRVIVTPERRSSAEPPIFLIGVHRSGTTLLRLVVDSHSHIACPAESFFIAPLQAVLRDEKALEGLRAMGFQKAQVLERLRETVSWFFEMYAAAQDKARWADKTPSYIDCLDFIDALYGEDARYALIFRNGLDVASSRLLFQVREVQPHIEACAGDAHAGAARYWAVQCEKMLAFRERRPALCHELRYEALTTDPEAQLRPLFAFFGEAWEPQVLRFHEQRHDVWTGLQDARAAEIKGFQPNIGAHRAQPRPVLERMLAEAGPMLERLGYATDIESA